MKRWTTLVAALSCALTAVACSGGSDSSEPGKYKIGMANFTLGAPYFIGISKTVEREGAKAGADVVVTDAKGDAAALTANIADLLAKDVDGVIISGGPLEAAPAALNAIKQKGIPVVLVDRKFQTGEYTSWVGPDNTALGVQSGEYISKTLQGKGKVAVVRGGPADNTIGLARTAGLKSVLERQPGIRLVVAPDFAEWSSDGGLKVMENLLAKNGDLNAVFCENDSMCLGAQKAITDSGRAGQIFLAGVDGQKEALAAIQQGGSYQVTGLNNAVTMGTTAYQRLSVILGNNGTAPEKDTVVPSPEITKENVGQYYDPNSEF
jgi:ribose transport system substrate-binding protein